MLPTAKDWLNHLMAEARSAQLDHLDVLMSLTDEQASHLQAVGAAIQGLNDYEKTPNEHGFTSREAMLRCLITAHLQISRKKLDKLHHEDFIASVLSENLPLTLTRHDTLL
ncbi:hypothetical protein F0169_13005 [Pseudomonas sp. MAFF 212408]|uniref:Uncharacterized protein n=1 Tax=Pseudomonas kitaguniensis TaxID=2607908 RepID=A0A5N7KL55_9PSED|nr:hypothetical protein [Pseudomonas kitaguniensis]MPR02906.1 hypothetical protein [Pseudomonas kitaguniensis]